MAEQRTRRLLFVRAADLELWRCRPIGEIDVLDLHDHHVGRFDGLIVDALEDRPLFLVIRRGRERKAPAGRFLIPVGDAWFDESERAVRIDVKPGSREAPRFDPDEFDRMSEAEAADYERKVLAECCPEVGLHRDGTPDYARLSAFQCPSWLRSPADEAVHAKSDRTGRSERG
jgi:hypothetical protein